MGVTVASLMVKIDGDSKGAVAAARQSDDAFEGTARKAGTSAGAINKASLLATAGIVGIGLAAVKTAADFERDMDQVGAVAHATGPEMDALRKEALKLGADTSKSAGEAALAFQELAAGGRSAAQILGGEGRAAVALSEAGNYDLAASAEYVATVMDAWKDTQLTTNEVVNRSAGVANASKFGVQDLAGAVAQAGGVAASMGVSFGDLSTVVAATASSFSSGSDAGTSFKTFLLQLDGTTEKAKKTISEYGLEFRNANGELKPMAEIAEELRTKVGTLGEAQQVAALKTIFGNDAYRTAVGLMQTSAAEFTAMSQTMASTNAAEIAQQRMGNLSGSVEELKGSLETAGIALGTKAIPALTGLTDVGTKAVNAFGELPGSTQNIVLLGAAATVALPGMISLLDKGTDAVARIGKEFKTGKISASTFALGLTAVVAGVDALLEMQTGEGLFERIFGDVSRAKGAQAALAQWDATLLAAGPNAERLALATAKFDGVIAEASKGLESYGSGLEGVFQNADRLVGKLTGTYDEGFANAVDRTKALEEQTRLLASEMLSSGANVGQLKTVYDQLPEALRKVFDETTNVTTAYAMSQDNVEKARFAIEAYDLAIAKVAEVTPVATSAADAWAATVAEAEDGTKDFADAIDVLHKRFAETNPTVIALNAQHAKLTEELEDLKDKGDAATASERRRIDQIEDELLPAIDKEIKHYDDNQKAMEGMSGALVALLGEQGYGGFKSRLDELKVPQEDQIYVTGKIADAYSSLTKNDLPATIAKFGELKKELSPDVWAALAEAVGPAVLRSVKDGLNSSNWGDIVSLMETLGRDMVLGVQAGVLRYADLPAAALANATRAAVAAAQSEIDSHSPSRVTEELLGIPMMEGIVEGIKARQAVAARELEEAVASGIDAAIAKAKTKLAALDLEVNEAKARVKFIETFGPGTTGPAGGFPDGRVTSSIPNDPNAYGKDGTRTSYIGGGQVGALPTGDIPVGTYVPGFGYKTANGYEQTLGAAADINAAYLSGQYRNGYIGGGYPTSYPTSYPAAGLTGADKNSGGGASIVNNITVNVAGDGDETKIRAVLTQVITEQFTTGAQQWGVTL